MECSLASHTERERGVCISTTKIWLACRCIRCVVDVVRSWKKKRFFFIQMRQFGGFSFRRFQSDITSGVQSFVFILLPCRTQRTHTPRHRHEYRPAHQRHLHPKYQISWIFWTESCVFACMCAWRWFVFATTRPFFTFARCFFHFIFSNSHFLSIPSWFHVR